MKRSAFLTSLLSLLGTPKGLLGKGETPSCAAQTTAPADPDAGPSFADFIRERDEVIRRINAGENIPHDLSLFA